MNNHIIHTSPQAICKENYLYDGKQGVSLGNTHVRKLKKTAHFIVESWQCVKHDNSEEF